jgi:hypothetical protein
MILQQSRSYQEFVLIMDCFSNRLLKQLEQKHSAAEIKDLTEKFIKNHLHKRVDLLFINIVYWEMRLMARYSERKKFMSKTPLWRIFETFFSRTTLA